MDWKPKSPPSNQVNQIKEKGVQFKRQISDFVNEKLLTMHGRPPAQFHSSYTTRDEGKHAVDISEKSCKKILIAGAMTLVMLGIGATLVGGILLAVTRLDSGEETVTVADLDIICPGDIVTQTKPAERHAVVSWERPALQTDANVTIIKSESNYEPNSSFEIGVHEVMYTIRDSRENEETCTFKVIVTDKEKPVFESCPGNIELVTDEADGSFPNPTWDVPGATDNAGPPKVTTNYDGKAFDIGTTVIRYTARDAAGNTASCFFRVTIIDGTPPVILDCPADLRVTTGQPRWTEPTAVDNGELVSFESDWKPGDTFPLGRTTVTYVAEDSVGLEAECSFTVVMLDLDPPVFVDCPRNITITTSEDGRHSAPVWQTPRATDNAGPPRVTKLHGREEFHLGRTTEISYEATDASGNDARCTFYVTINDGTPPTVEGCPSNITQPNDWGTPTGQVDWTPPIARDNGGFVGVNSNWFPGDIFPLGSTRVIYTVVDSAGLMTECSFVVTIIDAEAPVFISCPPNIEKTTDSEGNFDPPTWPSPWATDNAGTPQVTTPHRFGEFELGVKTPIRYAAADASGNNATCEFYVLIIDRTPPVIRDCPTDIHITTDPRLPTGRGNWTEPSATDNGKHVTLLSNVNSGDALHIGTTRVTYTAVDDVGLTATCHFTVTVSDEEDPVFINCPSDFFRATDAEGKYDYPFWQTPQAIDNSGEPTRVTTTYRFQMFELNSRTRIKYVATDVAGNNATCIFHVSVTDGTPPELEDCPNDMTVSTEPNMSTSRVNWSLPSVADNSKHVDLMSNWQTGDHFPLGETKVIYTAVDPSGLTSECHFTVTVLDTEKPAFTNCPADIELTTNARGKYNYPIWKTPHALDNSGQVEVTTNFEYGPFELGVKTPIEYLAVDADNNSAMCIFYVTVIDGTPPVIDHCPSDQTISTDPRLPTGRANWTEPTAKDNGGYVRLTSNWNPGDSFPLGRTKVVYTALDAVGLRDRCRFAVTVQDKEPPTFDSCPLDIERETDASGMFEYPMLTFPHAIDNSGQPPDVTSTYRFQMFTLDEPTPIEYFATDRAGNTATCKFHVTIKDRTPPVISDCPGDIIVSIDPRSSTGRAFWTVPEPSDNGNLVSFEGDWNSGDQFPPGETNVTYVAMDAAGLTTECRFTVTVESRCNLSVSTPGQKSAYEYRFPFPIAQQADDASSLHFDFAVRSAGTVFIALAEDETSSKVYEIGLGRSKSFIRCGILCKPRYITVATPDLLSGSKYRRFWATYSDGLVQVGRGSEEPFLEWQDPSSTPLDVQRFGIASYHKAKWKGYLCKNETQKATGWL